jgi:hypothetical protein
MILDMIMISPKKIGSITVQGAADPDGVPTYEDLGIATEVYWMTG